MRAELVVLLSWVAAAGVAVPIDIAGVFPLHLPHGVMQKHAAELAIASVNADTTLLPHNDLRLVVVNSVGHPVEAGANLAKVLFNASTPVAAAFETDGTESVSVSTSTLAAVADVPFISPLTDETDLTEVDHYRFLRLRVLVGDTGRAVHALFESLGWSTMDIILGDVDSVDDLVSALLEASEGSTVETNGFPALHPDIRTTPRDEFEAVVTDLLADIRTAGHRAVFMLTDTVNARVVLHLALQEGMLNGGSFAHPTREPYVWVGLGDWFTSPGEFFQVDEYCGAGCVADLKEAMAGSLILSEFVPPEYGEWLNSTWYPSVSNVSDCEAELSGSSDWTGAPPPPDARIGAVVDTITLIAQAAHAVCEAGVQEAKLVLGRGVGGALRNHTATCVEGEVYAEAAALGSPPVSASPAASGTDCVASVLQASALMAELLDTTIDDGLSGPVASVNGDRSGHFTVYSLETSGDWTDIGLATSSNTTFSTDLEAATWPGGGSPPASVAAVHCVLGELAVQDSNLRSACVACPVGTVGRTSAATGGNECRVCPTGTVCDGGNHLTVATGYWYPPLDTVATSVLSDPFSCRQFPDACCPSGRCAGGVTCVCCPGGLTPTLPVRTTQGSVAFDLIGAGISATALNSPQVVANNSVCNVGHTGLLCADCLDGYGPQRGECVVCNRVSWGPVVLAELLVVAIVVVYALEKTGDSARVTIFVDILQLLSVVIAVRENSAVENVDLSASALHLAAFTPGGCMWDQSAAGAAASGFYIPLALLLHAVVVVSLIFLAKRHPSLQRLLCCCCRRFAEQSCGTAPSAAATPVVKDRTVTAGSPPAVAEDGGEGRGSGAAFGTCGGGDSEEGLATPGDPPALTSPARGTNQGRYLRLASPIVLFRSFSTALRIRTQARIQSSSFRNMMLRTMTRCLFLSYLVLSVTSMQWFNCRQVVVPGDSQWRMEHEPAMECFTTVWYVVLALVAAPVLAFITLGVPATILCKARPWSRASRARVAAQHSFYDKHGHYLVATGKEPTPALAPEPSSNALSAITKLLLLDVRFYRVEVRTWYHAVFLLRRAIMSLLFVALSRHLVVRQIALFSFSVVLLAVQWAAAPFAAAAANRVAGLFSVLLVLVAGLEVCRVALLENHAELRTDPADDSLVTGLNWAVVLVAGVPLVCVGVTMLGTSVMRCTQL